MLSSLHRRIGNNSPSATQWVIRCKNEEQKPTKPPFPLARRGTHSNTAMHRTVDPTHHPKPQLRRFTHFGTGTPQSPHLLQWGAPNSPLPNYPFPLTDPQTQLPASSLDPSDLPWQTTSISVLPFCHNALDRQTDRPTDQQMVNGNGM